MINLYNGKERLVEGNQISGTQSRT